MHSHKRCFAFFFSFYYWYIQLNCHPDPTLLLLLVFNQATFPELTSGEAGSPKEELCARFLTGQPCVQ